MTVRWPLGFDWLQNHLWLLRRIREWPCSKGALRIRRLLLLLRILRSCRGLRGALTWSFVRFLWRIQQMRLIGLQGHTATWFLRSLYASRVVVLEKVGCIHCRWSLEKGLLLLKVNWVVLFNRIVWLLLLLRLSLNERPWLLSQAVIILELGHGWLLPNLSVRWRSSLNIPSLSYSSTLIHGVISLINALARWSGLCSLLDLLRIYFRIIFKVCKLFWFNHNSLQCVLFLQRLVSWIDLLSTHLVLLNHVADSRLSGIAFR